MTGTNATVCVVAVGLIVDAHTVQYTRQCHRLVRTLVLQACAACALDRKFSAINNSIHSLFSSIALENEQRRSWHSHSTYTRTYRWYRLVRTTTQSIERSSELDGELLIVISHDAVTMGFETTVLNEDLFSDPGGRVAREYVPEKS
jgi:hypothetical protein